MAKRDRTRESLDTLSLALEHPHSELAHAALSKALAARSSLVVAAALEHIYTHALDSHEPAILAAFERAMVDPVRRDPGCRVKIAAVKALDHLRVPSDEVFLAGSRHVQPEPVWQGTQDTATQLRVRSALALVHRRHAEALVELARLLADPHREVRRAAAEAIAANNDAFAGVPLLMLKLSIGDAELDVISACFCALLSLDADQRLEYVAAQLDVSTPNFALGAAIALGQERPPGALEYLRARHASSVGELRAVVSLAIAMLRSDAAWDFMLDQLREAPTGAARDALTALAPYRDHGDLRERIDAALACRGEHSPPLAPATVEKILG